MVCRRRLTRARNETKDRLLPVRPAIRAQLLLSREDEPEELDLGWSRAAHRDLVSYQRLLFAVSSRQNVLPRFPRHNTAQPRPADLTEPALPSAVHRLGRGATLRAMQVLL